jgi:hypothetical protein
MAAEVEASTVAVVEASTVAVVGSAAGGTSEVELRGPATVEVARVLGLPEPIGAEAALRAPMELTDRRDLVELTDRRAPARTAAGHMVARPTARDTLGHMAAGLRRHHLVHVTVQLLITAQTQRQPREITALLALAPIAARPQGTLRRQPTAEALRLPGRPAGWSLPIDQVLQ